MPGASYSEWYAKRRFIADAVYSDGSILDIGCANGFLLRSLQEWSQCSLDPYGIDVREDLIEEARELFPHHRDHFRVLDATHIESLQCYGFPRSYEFVFWNFLGSWRIDDVFWRTTLTKIQSLATRRVILGFYGKNRYAFQSKEWHEERGRLRRLPAKLKSFGFALSGSRTNPTRYNQVIAWIDKDQPEIESDLS